ncbi:MAG: cytochrome c oxidase assembly protein [Pirellulales bacterium]|nr:cytochrome c oxidase assembly protein [Pirellulales bacterium]
MSPWQILGAQWNWASPVWLVAAAILFAYLVAFRNALSSRMWFLAVGLAILVFSYVSPIGVLADGYLFSAHIVQHLLLLLVVPMCLVLSLPRNVSFGRLSNASSSQIARWAIVGWLSGLGTMWFWHVPSLCNASTSIAWLGAVRDATFLLAGLAFWWPIYAPRESHRLAAPNAVVYLFSACVGCTLLGIYITFTTVAVCPVFANPVGSLPVLTALYDVGLTSAADQHLGGLLMWVPPCTLYVCAIISVLCRWYTTIDVPLTSKHVSVQT